MPEIALDTAIADTVLDAEVDILAVNDALESLAAVDARLAAVVELRYFVGLPKRRSPRRWD